MFSKGSFDERTGITAAFGLCLNYSANRATDSNRCTFNGDINSHSNCNTYCYTDCDADTYSNTDANSYGYRNP